MATNEGWPEAFGFSLNYGAPCVVNWIEEGGSAEESGLQVNITGSISCWHPLYYNRLEMYWWKLM